MSPIHPNAAALLAKGQKKFGEDQIMVASQIPVGDPISTGVLGLDAATTFGGFPSNRVVELYGREGSGKTTLAIQTMVHALRRYPEQAALFMDMEHKTDKDWLRMLVGDELMDSDRILYVQPPHIERATNIYREMVNTGMVCCAILDSIGGAPTARFSDDAEKGRVGGNALGVGEFARAAATHASLYDCLTIGINQVRAKMGMGFTDDTPGGWAWKHACCVRVEVVKGKETETIKPPGEEKAYPIGHNVFAKVRKNGVGPEGRTAMYWFFNVWTPEWGFGVDHCDEVSRLGILTRVIQQRPGGWYVHPAFPAYKNSGEHKVQNLLNVKKMIRDDEALRATLSSEILARLSDHLNEVAPISDPEAPIEIGSLMLSGGVVD